MKQATRHHCCAMDTLLYIGLCCSIIRLAFQQELDSTDDRPSYQFRYQIHDLSTKDYKTHEEVSENGFVRGTYTVRESNGDLREVSYTAGDSRGFQAMVRIRPTFEIPLENETSKADQTTDSGTSKASTTDTPLKIQLGTGRRSYNFGQDKQVAEKLSKVLHTRAKLGRHTPNLLQSKLNQ